MELFEGFQRQIRVIDDRLKRLDWQIRLGSLDAVDAWQEARKEHEYLLAQNARSGSAWASVELARAEGRPHARIAIEVALGSFSPLSGARNGPDDPSVIGGTGRLGNRPVLAVGFERGSGPDDRLAHNYGMPGPDGFRKVQRLIAWAERHNMPIVTFIDTPGAYPGLESEVGGVAEAIARTMWTFAGAKVPTCAVILGEGGSGGALALAVTDRTLMMENAIFSVISPEACSSILWRDHGRSRQAAELLRLTAKEVFARGFVDELIAEPEGGAHRRPREAMAQMRLKLRSHVEELVAMDADQRNEMRYQRFRNMGRWLEG